MPLFCKAQVETGQQHVACLLGYEGLHTFVIVFIALSQEFFTCVCGDVWCHRERERERESTFLTAHQHKTGHSVLIEVKNKSYLDNQVN